MGRCCPLFELVFVKEYLLAGRITSLHIMPNDMTKFVGATRKTAWIRTMKRKNNRKNMRRRNQGGEEE
jgi:hypothetical protein